MYDDLDPTERDIGAVRPKPQMDVGRILGSAALDNVEDFEPEDEYADEVHPIQSEAIAADQAVCRYSAQSIRMAADALREGLENNQVNVPKSAGSIEALRRVGMGPWYRWLDVIRSTPFGDDSNVGSLVLFCCARPGHRLRILRTPSESWVVEEIGQRSRKDRLDSVIEEEVSEAFDDVDERTYDERTYGDLVPDLAETLYDTTSEFDELWRNSKASDAVVAAFRSAGLFPVHFSEMSKTFNEEQAIRWVNAFGAKGIEALRLIGLEYSTSLTTPVGQIGERFFLLLNRMAHQLLERRPAE